MLALAISILFTTQSSPRIKGAGLHNLRHTLWFAKSVAAFQQAQCGSGVQAGAAVDIAVFARHDLGQLGAGLGHAQALANVAQELDAAHFMADVARPLRAGCSTFAQIVHEASKAHFQRRLRARSNVEHQPQVHTGINFRMVLCRLRHAPQRMHFGQHHGQSAAVAQNF